MAGVEKTGQTKIKTKSLTAQKNRLISSMLDVYIRGKEKGSSAPRAARLVEKLYSLAVGAESESIRLAATKEIFDRIDGKVVEKKEIKSVHIEGIVYIPAATDVTPDYLTAELLPVQEGSQATPSR
jgi:hypothetical protein